MTTAKKLRFQRTATDLIVLPEVEFNTVRVVRRDIPVCKGFIMAIDGLLLPYQPVPVGGVSGK